MQSIRVVEFLENHGKGLNLAIEVRDGIKNHQTEGKPTTLEGKIVRICDKIAYINHDIDDAIRGQIISEGEIPKEYTDILGHNLGKRLDTLIHDIVTNSENKNDIIMSTDIEAAMHHLREFMFDSVYMNKRAKGQEEQAERLLETLFLYYEKHLERLPEEYIHRMERMNEPPYRVVCDYIAGMTDRYAVSKFKELMIPSGWSVY
jgi:dGTPase